MGEIRVITTENIKYFSIASIERFGSSEIVTGNDIPIEKRTVSTEYLIEYVVGGEVIHESDFSQSEKLVETTLLIDIDPNEIFKKAVNNLMSSLVMKSASEAYRADPSLETYEQLVGIREDVLNPPKHKINFHNTQNGRTYKMSESVSVFPVRMLSEKKTFYAPDKISATNIVQLYNGRPKEGQTPKLGLEAVIVDLPVGGQGSMSLRNRSEVNYIFDTYYNNGSVKERINRCMRKLLKL